MTTRFDAIFEAFLAVLTTQAAKNGFKVEDARIDAFDKEELPAANALPGAHSLASEGVWLNNTAWAFDLRVELCATGPSPRQQIGAFLADLVPAVSADPELKALVYLIEYSGAGPLDRAGADLNYFAQVATWRFEALTDLNAIN